MVASGSYYQQEIFIPHVDENDTYLEPVERWKAHREGILHRAFTVAVFLGDRIICQHRKHPVFDDVFDLTASSHPKVLNNIPQSIEDAIQETLQREWLLAPSSIRNLRMSGFALYDDPDPKSEYREHEYCYLYTAHVDSLPTVQLEMAYGFSLLTTSELKDSSRSLYPALAPWVVAFLEKGLMD